MRNLLLIITAISLTGCVVNLPPEEWKDKVTELKVKGLEGCVLHEIDRGSPRKLYITRCPHSTTTTRAGGRYPSAPMVDVSK